jgi:hypothetical protein
MVGLRDIIDIIKLNNIFLKKIKNKAKRCESFILALHTDYCGLL